MAPAFVPPRTAVSSRALAVALFPFDTLRGL